MKTFRRTLRASGALPAALLLVFLAAQVELAAHQHAVDDATGDCAQCQHAVGHAVVSEAPAAPFFVAGRAGSDLAPVSCAIGTGYRLQARGPPTPS